MCIVNGHNTTPYGTGIQCKLSRLADLTYGEIIRFIPNDNQNWKFENRTTLYDKFNLDSEDNELAFWSWKATENIKDPDKDYVQNLEKLNDFYPIEVYKLIGAYNEADILERLKRGIPVGNHKCRKILFSGVEDVGLLCDTHKDLEITSEFYKLKPDTTFLISVSGFKADIVEFEKGERCVYRYTEIDSLNPRERLVRDPLDVVKSCVQENFGWKAAKESQWSKKEWQTAINLLKSISQTDVSRDIAEKLKCSEQDAEKYFSDFTDYVYNYMNGRDITDDIILSLLDRNDELRTRFSEIFKEEWGANYQSEYSEANQKLEKLNLQFIETENQKKQLEDKVQALKNEIDTLEDQKAKKEKLAQDVEQKIKDKISAAKKDASDFISQMALYGQGPYIQNENTSNDLAIQSGQCNGDVEQLSSLDSALECIEDNLDFIEDKRIYPEISAFLLAAYVKHQSILFAGPHGDMIADALSSAVTGKTTGKVMCDGKYDARVWKKLNDCTDQVVLMRNILKPDWIDNLPDFLQSTPKYCFCTCPIKENLLLEPKGLYDYVLPIFTDGFVKEPDRSLDWYFGIYKQKSDKKETSNKERDRNLRKFRINEYSYKRWSSLLSLAEKYGLTSFGRYLFAYYPYAYLTGQIEQLKEMMDEDTHLQDEDKKKLESILGTDE